MAGMARNCMAMCGEARQARKRGVGLCKARHDKAGQGRRDGARQGCARRGAVSHCRQTKVKGIDMVNACQDSRVNVL